MSSTTPPGDWTMTESWTSWMPARSRARNSVATTSPPGRWLLLPEWTTWTRARLASTVTKTKNSTTLLPG